MSCTIGSGEGQACGIPSICARRGKSTRMYLARLTLSGLKKEGSRTASGSTGLKRTSTAKSSSSRNAPRIAINDKTNVQLAGDVLPLADVQTPDFLALGARLVRDELHAQDGLRLGSCIGYAARELDAAAFAAASCVDLGLDDTELIARLFDDLLGCRLCLVDGEGNDAF